MLEYATVVHVLALLVVAARGAVMILGLPTLFGRPLSNRRPTARRLSIVGPSPRRR